VFELITLEDVFNGSTKAVQVRGSVRHCLCGTRQCCSLTIWEKQKMSYQIMPSFTSGSTLVFNEDGSGAGAGFWVLSTLHERCD
jgi:hypothetical protein